MFSDIIVQSTRTMESNVGGLNQRAKLGWSSPICINEALGCCKLHASCLTKPTKHQHTAQLLTTTAVS